MGNRTTRTAAGVTTTYTWDDFGNLKTLTGGVTYGYDGRGRRVTRVGGGITRRWLYDGQLRVVAEYENDVLKKRFVYASRANVPDTMLDVASGVTYRYLTDQLGSVRAVVNASTGAAASILNYDAWGNVLGTSTNVTFQPFGFAGGIYDATVGFVHFGARDYDPATGRWGRKDSARWGGGLNFYAYCDGDPSNCVDSSGLDGEWYSWLGKVWAATPLITLPIPLPGGSQVGMVVALAGWAAGGNAPTFGNNGVESTNNPLVRPFTPAVTLGSVMCYAEKHPSDLTRQHERQHTYQAEVLGPFYLPAHVISQATAYGYSYVDGKSYSDTNDRVHSDGNLLERGPMSTPPRPW